MTNLYILDIVSSLEQNSVLHITMIFFLRSQTQKSN